VGVFSSIFYHRTKGGGGSYKNKGVCIQNLKEIKLVYPCYPRGRKGQVGWQKKKKGAGRGSRDTGGGIGTTLLKQQGRCYSATNGLMMGKSEASSVHI